MNNDQPTNQDLSQFSPEEQRQLSIVPAQADIWHIDTRPEGGPIAYYLVLVDSNPDIERKQVPFILNVDQQTGALTVEPYTPQDYDYTIHDGCDHEHGECIEDDPEFQQKEYKDDKLAGVANRLTHLQHQLRQQRIAERILAKKKLDPQK